MSQSKRDHFVCPGCQTKYAWKLDLSGRRVKCRKCSSRIRIPNEPNVPAVMLSDESVSGATGINPALPTDKKSVKDSIAAGEDDTYDLNLDADDNGLAEPEAKPITHGDKCPNCNAKVNPSAVVCLNCGYNFREGKRMATQVVEGEAEGADSAGDNGGAKGGGGLGASGDQYRDTMASAEMSRLRGQELEAAQMERQHKIDEVYVPLGMLGGAFILALINILLLAPNSYYYQNVTIGSTAVHSSLIALIEMAFYLVIQLPATFFAILIVTAIFSTGFGPILTALYKLASLVCLTLTVNFALYLVIDIVTEGFGGIGFMLRQAFMFFVFYVATIKLFDIEAIEAMVLYLITNFLPIVFAIFLIMLLTR